MNALQGNCVVQVRILILMHCTIQIIPYIILHSSTHIIILYRCELLISVYI